MRVMITGGSGFIGRNLREALAPNYEVLAPRHAELELLDEDAVRAYLRAQRPDVIVHSATKPGHRNAKDPADQVCNNTRMFFNLARNADAYGKMIVLTSGAVYDMRAYQPKMPETYFDTRVPADEVGYSKYIIAKYIARAERIVELRPFGVFGKYEDWEIRFISNAICKALCGLPITLRQDRMFDYIYIDDLVRVIEHFIRHDAADTAYNATPDRAVSLAWLAERVRDLTGADVPVTVGQPGRGMEYSGDNARLRTEAPAVKFTEIDDAIRQLIDWYRANRALIDREKLLVDK